MERDDGGSAWFFSFFHSEVTRNTNIITWVLFISFTVQNARILFYFLWVLIPLAFEGAFQAFFILVYECSLGPKVLMTIEILRKKCWKQNLGTDYNITTSIRYRCTLPAYIRFKGVYYMHISEFPRTVNFLIWENEHMMTLKICHYR